MGSTDVETGCHYVAQGGLTLTVPFTQRPNCWDYSVCYPHMPSGNPGKQACEMVEYRDLSLPTEVPMGISLIV